MEYEFIYDNKNRVVGVIPIDICEDEEELDA